MSIKGGMNDISKRIDCIKKIRDSDNFDKNDIIDKNKTISNTLIFFKEINRDLISNPELLFGNLFINIFSGSIYDTEVFLIDFKFLEISIEEIDKLLKKFKELEDEFKSYILTKIGYCYDKNKMMLSTVYLRGHFNFLNPDIIFSFQDKAINQDIIKLSIIDNFIKKNKLILNIKTNILHPSLMFYSNRRGLIYFDYIFLAFYDLFKQKFDNYIFDFYGIFRGDEGKNYEGNLFICNLIYFFMNKFHLNVENSRNYFNRHVPYEEIIRKVKIHFLYGDNSFFDSLSENFKIYIDESKYREKDSINRLIGNYKKIFFSKIIEPIGACEKCLLTCQQTSSEKFIIHFPCFKIYCDKCFIEHKCVNDYAKIFKNRYKVCDEINNIFNFLPEFKEQKYNKYYRENCEDSLNNLDDEYKIVKNKLIYKENEFNTFFKLLIKNMDNKYNEIKKKYNNYLKNINEDKIKKGKLDNSKKKFEEIKNSTVKICEVKNKMIKSVLNQNKIENDLINEILNSLNKLYFTSHNEIPKEFDDYINRILEKTDKEFYSKYKIEPFLEEILPTYKKVKISITNANSNSIFIYDLNLKKTTTINLSSLYPKIILEKNSKYLSMKTGIFICGGNSSKKTYFYSYNNNNMIELSDLSSKHIDHSLLLIEKNIIFCIGGMNTIRCETFNLLTNRWKIRGDLEKPISKGIPFLFNGLDVYFFFGVYLKDKEFTQNKYIYKFKLYDKIDNWERVNFKIEKNLSFSPFNMAGIVRYNKEANYIFITGGSILNKGKFIPHEESYLFYFEDESLIKEKKHYLPDDNSWHTPGFKEALFSFTKDFKYINWGDNYKMIEINYHDII